MSIMVKEPTSKLFLLPDGDVFMHVAAGSHLIMSWLRRNRYMFCQTCLRSDNNEGAVAASPRDLLILPAECKYYGLFRAESRWGRPNTD